MSPLGATLFQTLINQRGWQDYTVFKKRYEQAAKQLADAEGDPSIATATVEKRQFHRWLRGDVRTPKPSPAGSWSSCSRDSRPRVSWKLCPPTWSRHPSPEQSRAGLRMHSRTTKTS